MVEIKIFNMDISNRINTREMLEEKVEILSREIDQSGVDSILLFLDAYNAEYDSEKTHALMGKIFDDNLKKFSHLPKKTAIYNHYRDGSRGDSVEFFTDRERAIDWLHS